MSEQITQQEAEALVVLRQETRESRTAANKKQAELEAEEERLVARLQAGTPVEPGPYFLLVTMEQTGRSVAWRGVVERELGKPFAEMELAKILPGKKQVLKVLQEVGAGTVQLESDIDAAMRRGGGKG